MIEIRKKFPNFALTYDNVLKMIGIYFRAKSRIPVILMGETGCGKTKLVSFLGFALGYELEKCDVHAGFDRNKIKSFIETSVKKP
eukprot:UN11187